MTLHDLCDLSEYTQTDEFQKRRVRMSPLTQAVSLPVSPCQVRVSCDGRLAVLHPAHHLGRRDHGHGTDQGVHRQCTVPHLRCLFLTTSVKRTGLYRNVGAVSITLFNK